MLQARLSAAGAGAVPPVPAALPGALADAHAAGRLAFLGKIQDLHRREAFAAHLAPLKRKKWFVYTKPPFAGPEAVLAYLARYTHRVAISNSRLVALDERGVTFRYKDYRSGQARYRTMTLSADEFIRRFLLHVLPKGFHRIRHYGLLASAGCKANIARAKELIDDPMPTAEPTAAQDTADPDVATDHRPPCPCCGGRMIIVEVFGRGGSGQSAVISGFPLSAIFAKPSLTTADPAPNPHRPPSAHRLPAGAFIGGFPTPAPLPRVDRSRRAGIRNPSRFQTFTP